jgi:hypothetical protein
LKKKLPKVTITHWAKIFTPIEAQIQVHKLHSRFGSKVIFFGIIVEKDDDDDDDDDDQKLKPLDDEFYGDASQGFQVKVRLQG